MVRGKHRLSLQTNKMDNYAVPRQSGGPQQRVVMGVQGQKMEQDPPHDSCLSEMMAAIHDLEGSLEPRLDAVAVDVALLRADLKKVSKKVTTVKTDIAHLQSTSKTLADQV
ncbi:hypothetical protein NDU88_006142 [Pleurodeles waltl]|uniref:Uncharacterized protein n=1 Tax=Pleurodeles waltl TaxID=8319 RepID=A0AAV7N033_PLEWA|nr:hypothetical protein NDU88_006142 [Pleurodeles waltl]